VWLAWQFDVPEKGEGMVQAFRREQSPYKSVRFPLRGLEADAQYQVSDVVHKAEVGARVFPLFGE